MKTFQNELHLITKNKNQYYAKPNFTSFASSILYSTKRYVISYSTNLHSRAILIAIPIIITIPLANWLFEKVGSWWNRPAVDQFLHWKNDTNVGLY